jgi:hypothetical protein
LNFDRLTNRIIIAYYYLFRVLAALKWPMCWIVGITLVTILLINLDKDPYVIGQQTMQIENIPFASIGVTPQGAIKSDYYENARSLLIFY